jgi:hypothetical protein
MPARSAGSVIFVPEELGPGPVGGVGEVLAGPLPVGVPAARWLRGGLPQERVPVVGVPEPDAHPDPTRVAASFATAAASGPSGSNSPSRLAGDRPPSGVRGRFSHRRIPKSL